MCTSSCQVVSLGRLDACPEECWSCHMSWHSSSHQVTALSSLLFSSFTEDAIYQPLEIGWLTINIVHDSFTVPVLNIVYVNNLLHGVSH